MSLASMLNRIDGWSDKHLLLIWMYVVCGGVVPVLLVVHAFLSGRVHL